MADPDELQRQFADADTLNNEYQKLNLKVNALFQFILDMGKGRDHKHTAVPEHPHDMLAAQVDANEVRLEAVEHTLLEMAQEAAATPLPPSTEPASGGVSAENPAVPST